MDTKFCKRCEKEKTLDKFTACNSTKDRLQAWCKICRNEIRKIARKEKKGCYATEQERYKDKHLILCRKLYYRRKKQAMEHYCPNGIKCASCGFDDIRVLSIDHVDGNGTRHRQELRGVSIYKWLVANNFPPGFQVLCMNCQFIKRHEQNGYEEV